MRKGYSQIILPVLTGHDRRTHAAIFSFMAGVAPPIDECGKLNACAIVGSRQQLSAMQTDFAERVGKTHGLERCLQGSPARHERVQRAYAHLTDPDAALSLP